MFRNLCKVCTGYVLNPSCVLEEVNCNSRVPTGWNSGRGCAYTIREYGRLDLVLVHIAAGPHGPISIRGMDRAPVPRKCAKDIKERNKAAAYSDQGKAKAQGVY